MNDIETLDLFPSLPVFRPFSYSGAKKKEFAAIDPYQEFFDYLVTQGKATAEAWDMVWENPRRSAQIGMKLAAHRIEPNTGFALAS